MESIPKAIEKKANVMGRILTLKIFEYTDLLR